MFLAIIDSSESFMPVIVCRRILSTDNRKGINMPSSQEGAVENENFRNKAAAEAVGAEKKATERQLSSNVMPRKRSWDNFDGDPPDKWRLSALATGPGCLSYGDLNNEPFLVKYFYAHEVEIENSETRDLVSVMRVVLISPDLHAVATVSDGVWLGLVRLVEFMGSGPYDPPLKVKLVESKTNKGRRMVSLVPA